MSHKNLTDVQLYPKLPDPLRPLVDLAYNIWWSWFPKSEEVFKSIDAHKWEQYRHNPVKLLNTVSEERLTHLAADSAYLKQVETLATQFRQYLQATETWAKQEVPQISRQAIAYFSIEYGFHPCLQTYAGGLGVLAAEHLKTSSDLGLPIVGVGLLYRQGYFRQQITPEGVQKEEYPDYRFEELPLKLCTTEQGEALTVAIKIKDRPVVAQIWQLAVGRVNVYFLDTNREDNAPPDRWITGQLYGGDDQTRLAQEYLLGIGGVKALQRLGYEPQVYHLNEGHAAFAMLEVACLEMERTGKSFEQIKDAVRHKGVFTTHTPVPAGHDTFSIEQMERYFSHYWSKLGLSRREFLNLGNHVPKEFGNPFNMTVLALRLCERANGVSKLNGKVCRDLWSVLYPDRPTEDVPIGHITNGVHVRTWTAGAIADLYAQYLDENWLDQVTDAQMWAVEQIPDQELWQRHQRLKEDLINFVRSRAQKALDPNALTIGFARRFSSYKRGDLLLYDSEKAKALLSNSSQPIQILFAGKAHPADETSKQIIEHLVQWSREQHLENRLVFIEDYDLDVAQKLVQGVDVWLNNPERPKEASGTSGQKVALNGGINCSVLDGWWCEAYQHTNGWAIEGGEAESETQTQEDAEALYQLLHSEIIPLYYERDDQGLPRRWLKMMKASIKTIAPYFNTERMVKEYVHQMYLPALTAEKLTAGAK